MNLNATVSISANIVEALSIYELEKHFRDFDVHFRGIQYGARHAGGKNIGLSVTGTKDNIRRSIKSLYTVANKRINGIETEPAKFIPDSLKHYLNTLESEDKYDKLYSYCADEYMKYCAQSDDMPHPEVQENFTY